MSRSKSITKINTKKNSDIAKVNFVVFSEISQIEKYLDGGIGSCQCRAIKRKPGSGRTGNECHSGRNGESRPATGQNEFEVRFNLPSVPSKGETESYPYTSRMN
ncbi:hypothetical protein F2P81_018166 [Scophthalmus maximus]|uniref:Uncharacterized protein n=1 Tax=Scophthalmus maximus TaxID=52904 RepID=A0A6A4SD83_SCOMX|nr:hypothetical protein F2P81_018166 [Scophthalmus maximus]